MISMKSDLQQISHHVRHIISHVVYIKEDFQLLTVSSDQCK